MVIGGNRYAVWPGLDATAEVMHAVVEQAEPSGLVRSTLCGAVNPNSLVRSPGHFSPKNLRSCGRCVETWKATLAPQMRRCVACGERLPPEMQHLQGQQMCPGCRSQASAVELAEQERLAARTAALRDAAVVVRLVNRYQDDMRFPTLLCGAAAEHGPVEAAADTNSALPYLRCECGWFSRVPEDHLGVLRACDGLSAETVGLYGSWEPDDN